MHLVLWLRDARLTTLLEKRVSYLIPNIWLRLVSPGAIRVPCLCAFTLRLPGQVVTEQERAFIFTHDVPRSLSWQQVLPHQMNSQAGLGALCCAKVQKVVLQASGPGRVVFGHKE